jgi:hypothetical protein
MDKAKMDGHQQGSKFVLNYKSGQAGLEYGKRKTSSAWLR